MDSRAVELINLELDGRLDDAGRAELDALLASDSAVRARREQLRLVARALASTPAPELPLDFRDGVLRRAQLPQRSNRTRRYWRGGLALAASVLVAVVVLGVVQLQPVPPGQLTGAMAPSEPTVVATRGPQGLELTFYVPAGPADIVIDVVGVAGGDGALAATTLNGTRPQIDGRRIVLPGVRAGQVTVILTGDVGGFTALLVRGNTVTPVTLRSP